MSQPGLPERLAIVGGGAIACGLARLAGEWSADLVMLARSAESAARLRDEIGDGARHPHDPTWWSANITGAGLGKAGFEIYATDLP